MDSNHELLFLCKFFTFTLLFSLFLLAFFRF